VRRQLQRAQGPSKGGIWMLVRDPKIIKKLMLVQDVTHRELAIAVGWMRWDDKQQKWVGNHSMVGKILDKRSVTPEKAAAIAKFFGVGVDDLFLVRSDSETVTSRQYGKNKTTA